MDNAGQSLGLRVAAVCYSGIETLWRKTAEKVSVEERLLTKAV